LGGLLEGGEGDFLSGDGTAEENGEMAEGGETEIGIEEFAEGTMGWAVEDEGNGTVFFVVGSKKEHGFGKIGIEKAGVGEEEGVGGDDWERGGVAHGIILGD